MVYRTLCPAKVNLSLIVHPPDRTHFHPIETEFITISLFDELLVTVGQSKFAVEGMQLPEVNTVTRALRLIGEAASLPPLGIHLKKGIPDQAGLGGGSSDAAGLLRIIRKIVPPSVPDFEFESVAKSVGADVPFFLRGGHALGTGYGERITQLEDKEIQLVLAFPNAKCSTPAAYKALDEARLAESEHQRSQPGYGVNWITNDFHLVMPDECKSAIQTLIEHGAVSGGLCGSGSSVFGIFRSEAEAESVAADLCKNGLASKAVCSIGQQQSTQIEFIHKPDNSIL